MVLLVNDEGELFYQHTSSATGLETISYVAFDGKECSLPVSLLIQNNLLVVSEPLGNDGDGTIEEKDAFANNPNAQLDTDLDGIGYNQDTDDDNDDLLDVNDSQPLDAVIDDKLAPVVSQLDVVIIDVAAPLISVYFIAPQVVGFVSVIEAAGLMTDISDATSWQAVDDEITRAILSKPSALLGRHQVTIDVDDLSENVASEMVDVVIKPYLQVPETVRYDGQVVEPGVFAMLMRLSRRQA